MVAVLFKKGKGHNKIKQSGCPYRNQESNQAAPQEKMFYGIRNYL